MILVDGVFMFEYRDSDSHIPLSILNNFKNQCSRQQIKVDINIIKCECRDAFSIIRRGGNIIGIEKNIWYVDLRFKINEISYGIQYHENDVKTFVIALFKHNLHIYDMIYSGNEGISIKMEGEIREDIPFSGYCEDEIVDKKLIKMEESNKINQSGIEEKSGSKRKIFIVKKKDDKDNKDENR